MTVHVDFHIQKQSPPIPPELMPRVCSYIAGICNHMGCRALICNGHVNHIHLMFELSPDIPVAKLIQAVKSRSSLWIKKQSPVLRNFGWQTGYGAFTISDRDRAGIFQYIKNQQEHHKAQSYLIEYRTIMEFYRLNRQTDSNTHRADNSDLPIPDYPDVPRNDG